MILFTFYKKNGRRYFPISFEAADAERGIYRLLDGYVDTETAIDASSWCDLATVGESYEHEAFEIICEEV